MAAFVLAIALLPSVSLLHAASHPALQIPSIGDHRLNILSPTMLELERINTKAQDSDLVDSWNWVDAEGRFVPPNLSSVKVRVNGQLRNVSAVGFKRRPVYAPLNYYDLRIGNWLYLQLANPIAEGHSVTVTNDGSLWPKTMNFTAVADPLRPNEAIHVNQEGYLPNFPKKAIVGYYVGSLGELQIPGTGFSLVDTTGATVYQGTLTARKDVGYLYTPLPYQAVYQADFSSFNVPGEYRVKIPGLGTSMPFRIDHGIGMGQARTYALGMLHQRSGFDVPMPFTRFTHAADHLAPAVVPITNSPFFAFTWGTVASYATQVNDDNPEQTAPRLTEPSRQLYPFVNKGPINVTGGHFEAANYSKVTWNNAQVVHLLVFAADALPGVGALDNLGIPESGDGISDVLQEAKWEADCLVRLQDADGAFYYMIHPVQREYENNVLPENGDPQVVWPKNTAGTAAAVAALVQCASSPRFKQAYPQAASNYMASAMLGWKFLTNAIATHGFEGAYQRIMHFGDAFTHRDDLAWAACELFLATGDPHYRTLLETWFPDPASPDTARWGWWKMYGSYGNAVRSYASAVRSGRLQSGQLNANYLAKCIQTITDCGNDNLRWSQQNAYGTSFPDNTKRVQDAGWYFSTEQAFDIVVAQEFSPNPAYVDAILMNINYETGCNPVNVTYITGLGWKRQREVVDQYSANDRRLLSKIGMPTGNIQSGFVYTWNYGDSLALLCSPSDGDPAVPYPFYDRWADFWNVTAEVSTTGIARSFAATLWLAAQTQPATQPWTFTRARIVTPAESPAPGQPISVSLQVDNSNLAGARILWEALGQEPVFAGLNYSFTPTEGNGTYWIEAEVQWPDGRRAFAMDTVRVGGGEDSPGSLGQPQRFPSGVFSFQLSGTPFAIYHVEASTNLLTWQPVLTNDLPFTGWTTLGDLGAPDYPTRYYRARRAH